MQLKSIKITCVTFATLLSVCSSAQTQTDTVKVWDISAYSTETVNNLTADTQNWSPGMKSGKLIRFINNVTTDGELLKANSLTIPELDGIYIAKGVTAGNLLLCHNNGTSNGVQIQSNVSVTLRNMKKGQKVILHLRSSSKNANGIASAENLSGSIGSDYYTGATFKDFSFDVLSDSDISFKNSGGVIFNRITVLAAPAHAEPVATPVISIDGTNVSISCSMEGSNIYYTTMGGGSPEGSARLYTGSFAVSHTCTVRAFAVKDGYMNSDIASADITVPLVMPYKGRPYVNHPEALDRGAIATYTGTGSNWLVSWRQLVTDPTDAAFNVYRNGIKLNTTPITTSNNYMDTDGMATASYTVERLVDGNVAETAKALILDKGYWRIPINVPSTNCQPDSVFHYVPGDCMVADVDGDKEYEVVMKWDPSNRKDNSEDGYTGNVYIDAYKMNGTQLWRIDLGKNIRAGAHYTQLLVYDFDGDGKAEVCCKTAPGTKDGKGKYVIMGTDDPTAIYINSRGHIISGPEYLTVFSGLTGEELASTAYLPSRSVREYSEGGWGDSYGNRSERYNSCVAFLDGQHPSIVFNRGYYTAAYLWAVDFDGKTLTTRWLHSSEVGGEGIYGEGAHSIQVADVDGDLRDEIIFGAAVVDDDGTTMYRTGLGHGDALHVGDFVPDLDGLEVMMVHESTNAVYGEEMHEALTGKHLAGHFAGKDVGRGMCADIDEQSRGAEFWASDYVYDWQDNVISTKRPSENFRTYWDGDLYEELTERGSITKYAGRNNNLTTLVDMPSKYGAGTNVIKYTPCLQADIFGDWREEQIYYNGKDFNELWIFSTPYATSYRVPTLMQDHQYRMATIWQQSSYNQPPHLSYFLPDYVKNITSGIENVTDCGIQTADRCDSPAYNMAGQRVGSIYKGLIISNSKIMNRR